MATSFCHTHLFLLKTEIGSKAPESIPALFKKYSFSSTYVYKADRIHYEYVPLFVLATHYYLAITNFRLD